MSALQSSLAPMGLAIAREMQDKLRPAKVLLFGFRADGTHNSDSYVDAIALDEATAGRTKETLAASCKGGGPCRR